jgi:sugar phosphate isomerase/epimerase
MITRRQFARSVTAAAVAAAPSLSAARRLRVGVGAYTFHNLAIHDMITALKAMKVEEIEMSRGEFMLFNHPPAEMFETFRSKIDAAGIRCVSYYAPTIKTASDLDAAIRFARILGASNITGDPTGEILRTVDRRLSDAGMTFGIHNHYFKERGFPYESPEDILRALSGLSPTVGCTLDIGHIVSCGYSTIDAVKKLGPCLKLVHLKDIQAAGGEVNVPLGQGRAQVPQVMAELRRIGFNGLVALEYEREGEIRDDVARQLTFARKLAG